MKKEEHLSPHESISTTPNKTISRDGREPEQVESSSSGKEQIIFYPIKRKPNLLYTFLIIGAILAALVWIFGL